MSTSKEDFQALRADLTALERQRGQYDKTIEQQLNIFGQQLARFEQSEAQMRRDLAQAVSTIDELRVV